MTFYKENYINIIHFMFTLFYINTKIENICLLTIVFCKYVHAYTFVYNSNGINFEKKKMLFFIRKVIVIKK